MYKLFITSCCFLFMLSCSSAQEEQSNATSIVVEDIDSDTFKKKMDEDNVILLDVRTPKEIANGKIGGALEINVNSADFASEVAKLDKSKTYLVYCAGGVRSKKACKKMESVGFEKLYNLKGGYKDWKASGN